MENRQKNVSKKLHDLEFCRHYAVRRALKDSGVYFGQPPILNVSPASVSVSLRRMQKSGLIEKAADETDLRCNRMNLTEKGREQHEYIHGCFEEIDRNLYAGFSDEELATLETMLTRLCENLKTILPAGKKMEEIMQEELEFGGACRHGQTD